MQVGDTAVWEKSNNDQQNCEIFKIYTDLDGYKCYDVLLSERNVPLEYIYTPFNQNKLDKGDIILYKKNGIYEAYVSNIDWSSNSVQIRIIRRGLVVPTDESKR